MSEEIHARLLGLRVSLRGSRSLKYIEGTVQVFVPGGLRTVKRRGGAPQHRGGRRGHNTYYHPLEVWLWDNRHKLFEEARADEVAAWRDVGVRAGAPDVPVLSDLVQYTVSHACRVDGRAYPYRKREEG
jgi:hypothetical protein